MSTSRIAIFTAAVLALASGAAAAAEPAAGDKLWLACENGRDYPVRPIAVSSDGDLVTGYLVVTGRNRGVHVRLVPMGVGYRYAGPGIWFDGLRNQAVLNWGRPNEVACTVMQE